MLRYPTKVLLCQQFNDLRRISQTSQHWQQYSAGKSELLILLDD
ncbi:MAG: hypothetical protein OFPII_24540 [Osedax symbiont Rs1]|nr:MAG: hypothetical protein OFPII_24540 [Osedax symbiont Rs1]